MKKKVYPYLAVPTTSRKSVEKKLGELSLLRKDVTIESEKGRVFIPLGKAIDTKIIKRIFPKRRTTKWTTGSRKFTPLPNKGKKKSGRRTLQERAEDIFRFIDDQPEPFLKSEFQEIGLNPKTAESWIQLIEYIQSQPRIRVTKMGSHTYVERLENKYLTMMRKRILDSNLSLIERTNAMNDYINALLTLEKIDDMRIKK